MEQLLTKLKTIEPDKNFRNRSLTLILNTPQNEPRIIGLGQIIKSFQFTAAMGLAAALLFLLVGGSSILNNKILSPAMLSGLDPQKLADEQNNNIQIQLSQAEYFESSARSVEVALQETSGGLNGLKTADEELNRLLDELTL